MNCKKIFRLFHVSCSMFHDEGFTLIETIIYLALFAIVIGGGLSAAYQIMESSAAGANYVVLEQEANFIFRKLHFALASSENFSISNNRLVVINSTLPTNQSCLVFDLENNNLRLRRLDQATCHTQFSSSQLTGQSISVSNLTLADIPAQNQQPHGIHISFRLATLQNGRNASQDFSYTQYLR